MESNYFKLSSEEGLLLFHKSHKQKTSEFENIDIFDFKLSLKISTISTYDA